MRTTIRIVAVAGALLLVLLFVIVPAFDTDLTTPSWSVICVSLLLALTHRASGAMFVSLRSHSPRSPPV